MFHRQADEQREDMTIPDKIPSGLVLRCKLYGHQESITHCIWSPDGKVLASSSADKTIRLWDAHTGQELRTLTGHSSWINCVAWSPDGKVLASGSADKTVRLWNYITGQEIGILEGPIMPILQVSFSHDGRLLGSQTSGEPVHLWHAETLRSLIFPDQTLSSGSVILEEDYGLDELDNRQVLPISEPLYIQEILPPFEDLYIQYENYFQRYKEFYQEDSALENLDNQQVVLSPDPGEIEEDPTFDNWDDSVYVSAEGLAFHPNAPVLALLEKKKLLSVFGILTLPFSWKLF